MIRTVRCFAVLLSCVTLPSSVHAQQASALSFGVSAGLSQPIGVFGDFAKGGVNVTGSVSYRLSERLRLRGDVGFDRFASKADGGDGTDILSLAGSLVFPLVPSVQEAGVRPYLIGGLGVYRMRGGDASNTDLGVALGGGVEFALAGFETYLEARFANAWTGSNRGLSGLTEGENSTRWLPLVFGVRF